MTSLFKCTQHISSHLPEILTSNQPSKLTLFTYSLLFSYCTQLVSKLNNAFFFFYNIYFFIVLLFFHSGNYKKGLPKVTRVRAENIPRHYLRLCYYKMKRRSSAKKTKFSLWLIIIVKIKLPRS